MEPTFMNWRNTAIGLGLAAMVVGTGIVVALF